MTRIIATPGPLALLIHLLLLSVVTPAGGVAPLRYHTHYRALVIATVEQTSVIAVPMVDTNQFMAGKSRKESATQVAVERIRLKIDTILSSNVLTADASHVLHPGSSVIVANPWADQTAPFVPGDSIETEIQLVSPDTTYHPADTRAQWWFFDPDEPNQEAAPRQPYRNVKVLTKEDNGHK